MSDSLLSYYERELDAIKRLATEFADTHPKIAGRESQAAGDLGVGVGELGRRG